MALIDTIFDHNLMGAQDDDGSRSSRPFCAAHVWDSGHWVWTNRTTGPLTFQP